MNGPWRIKEFAARTGVPEATLRAWERRYDLVQPSRSDGGYRLYSADDERRVAAMRAHMARGIAAAQAARLVLAEPAGPIDVPDDAPGLVGALLEAIGRYDATVADRLLESAFDRGRGPAITDVLMPVLREVGERWARDEFTVAHEHFASHLIERRLMQQAGAWDRGGGRLALLACPSGERHSLGLLCFGVALADRGWRVAYLGADMPVGHVADAAASLEPDAIVLSATDPERLTGNAGLVGALRARHRTLIAGAGATDEVAGRLGVDRLGLDPVAAAAAL